MLNIAKVLGCSFLMISFFTVGLSSDARSELAGENIAGNAPEGSYRMTCANVKMDKDMLVGKCLRIHDKKDIWESTSLNIYGCVDDIANIDGTLSCSKGGEPPKGSYRQTCRRIEVNIMPKVPLSAECKTETGYWIRTNHAGSCPQGKDLANLNGKLTCNP